MKKLFGALFAVCVLAGCGNLLGYGVKEEIEDPIDLMEYVADVMDAYAAEFEKVNSGDMFADVAEDYSETMCGIYKEYSYMTEKYDLSSFYDDEEYLEAEMRYSQASDRMNNALYNLTVLELTDEQFMRVSEAFTEVVESQW